MTRLIMLENKRKAKAEHSASREMSEGEQARQILEANGYVPRSRTAANGQYEFPCPFHEEPGAIGRGKATNFYLDKNTSKYYCQSAACGQKGNLLTLERFFGLDSDPNSAHRTLEQRLRSYESQLTQDRKDFLRTKQGISEKTMERFRVGYDTEHGNYLIPYMEGRRPIAFRWYNPSGNGPKGSKYWWEPGTFATLFNSGDGVGDPVHGRVIITEGEWKTMLACQYGYAAVSVPGAAQWKPEWSQTFNHAKEIIVCLDNDNAAAHRRDNECMRCKPPTATKGKDEWACTGHNPGQDGAAKLMDVFGHRARNVVLPLAPGERKTDLNEFVIRDGASLDDVAQVLLGLKASPFLVRSLGQIYEEPPEEAQFIIDGILPVGGRLLVTGAPKAGKSIFIENLALSIASGVPFLRRFNVNDGQGPSRVLLLDRELSARSLFDRLDQLIAERPGYGLAPDNLMIDHMHRIILDTPEAASQLIGLVRANNVQVIILDTAYKFFSGDVEKASSVMKAFATLDEVIQETGISVVLTHHHRKGNGKGGFTEQPSAEQVTGSLYWTGWPNGTVLINFLDRQVDKPFNTVASFVAFRDAAPPEPLALMRDRTSISYKEILPYSYGLDDEGNPVDPHAQQPGNRKLNGKNLAQFLMECSPVLEDEFIPKAAQEFGQKENMVKIHLLDILDRHPDFEREGDGSRGAPYTWRFKYEPKEEGYKELEDDQPVLELVTEETA